MGRGGAAVLRTSQNIAAAIAVLLSFILLILTIVWVTAPSPKSGDENKDTWSNVGLGGLSWTNLERGKDGKMHMWTREWNSFHWHPLCMIFGMVFCFTHAILVYRIPPWINFTKHTRKMIHFTIQGIACIAIVVGLVAVVRAHNQWTETKEYGTFPNFTSVHSWFGISVVVMFFMQWAAGFYSFWIPKLPDAPRAAYLPWHVWAGLFMYLMALATAGMGININNTSVDCTGFGKSHGSMCTGALKMSHAIAFIIFWLGAATVYAVLPRKDDVPRCEPASDGHGGGGGGGGGGAHGSALNLPSPSEYHGNTDFHEHLIQSGEALPRERLSTERAYHCSVK